jgi:hypothetical protein
MSKDNIHKKRAEELEKISHELVKRFEKDGGKGFYDAEFESHWKGVERACRIVLHGEPL